MSPPEFSVRERAVSAQGSGVDPLRPRSRRAREGGHEHAESYGPV